ncbi:MAG: regulatory protein RecX [Ignavibacteriaceae bacterium]|nr:regulatory protein RecX [Ignavibacterium sp.]MCC6254679.1 regulatory protein RecX [Ignavibacteriaceae bacterium]HMN24972.1 regulatory protein RecX [Ignavibacteriaceae bacterium]HRN27521.1 regulatory protein RecX [Ignavibacteriaceae bacterium]HRP93433.1 regulatory protein RecX [Ignavibacteriaceae bacterium]
MKIDRVARKDEKNVSVYFDDGQRLILSEDTFYNSGLRKGDEISEDRFSFFIEQNILYHIKQRALSFLSRRFHSERELLLKLKSKSYDERLIKLVLNELKEKSFIDDQIFANYFVEEKFKKKSWGKNKIRAALFSKGVSGSIIDETLALFDSHQDQNEAAFLLAKKKYENLKSREPDERKLKQKIISFLLSRGFEFEITSEAVNKIIKQDFD